MKILRYVCIFITTLSMNVYGQTLVPSKKCWGNCKVTDDHNARNEIYTVVQDGINDLMSKYISEVSKLKRNHEKDISTCNSKVSDLEKDMNALKMGVSFMAAPSRHITPKPRSKLQFEKTITEQGSAYNNRTSTFTAPVSGYYFFDLTIAVEAPSSADDYLRLHIMKNNVISSYLFIGWEGNGKKMWVKRSESTLLHLSKGDRVHVYIDTFPLEYDKIAGYDGNSPSANFNSHFSGHLIN